MATHEPAIESTKALGPADHGRLLSAEEFAAAEFVEPWAYERVDGRLVVMSPDGEAHDDCSETLRDHLGAYRLAHHDVVERVVSEAWVRVSAGTDRIGDIGVYLVSERPGDRRPDRVPEIMFEIVSPGEESRRRDYGEKRPEYLRLGVREYVIVDRFAGTVTAITATAGAVRERALTRSEEYSSELLPGLAIPLADVLPE
jgi:Uma2 family endonuclease